MKLFIHLKMHKNKCPKNEKNQENGKSNNLILRRNKSIRIKFDDSFENDVIKEIKLDSNTSNIF